MKKYKDITLEILFLQEEDVIRTSDSITDESDNVTPLPWQ